MLLLDKCELKVDGAPYNDFLIAKFDELQVLPFATVEAAYKSAGRRIRLTPPYREGLSQAFGLFFMRVGNPQDLQKLP